MEEIHGKIIIVQMKHFNNFIFLCNNIKYTLLVYIEINIREKLLMEYAFNTDNIIFKDYHSISTYLNKYLKNDKIIEWHQQYITDDDQNLVLQLYYEKPHLFHLIHNYTWFSLYKYYK